MLVCSIYSKIHQFYKKYFSNDKDFNVKDEKEEASDDDKNPDPEQRKRGRPEEDWDKVGNASKKQKTNEPMDDFRQLATSLGTSFFQLLAFYGKREANKNGDEDLIALYTELNR